jgi:hypothetical protein
MTAESDDDIMDSLFHGCALAAYVDQAVEEKGRPDMLATRQRAYRYYEEALAAKNRRKSARTVLPICGAESAPSKLESPIETC